MMLYTTALLSVSFLTLPLATHANPIRQIPIIQNPYYPVHLNPSTSIPTLANRLSMVKSATIFADYVSQVNFEISDLLTASGMESNTTLLIPTNEEIEALPRAPHLGPAELYGARGNRSVQLSGREEEDARREYLEKWVRLHILQGWIDPDLEGKRYETMVEGREVSFLKQDGITILMPDGIRVKGAVSASNGRIMFIGGALDLENSKEPTRNVNARRKSLLLKNETRQRAQVTLGSA